MKYRIVSVVCGFAGLACLVIGYSDLFSNWWAFALSWAMFSIFSGIFALADRKAVLAKAVWSPPLISRKLKDISRTQGYEYVLYLRPLRTDATLKGPTPKNIFQLIMPNFGMPYIELQDWLLRSVPKKWRFLSEGGLKSNVRPVELLVSEDWFSDIVLAGEFVDVVLLVPGDTPGIIKEQEYFMEHRVHNIVIIAPPRFGNESYFSSLQHLRNEVANNVLKAPASGAFILPAWISGGLIFEAYPLTHAWLIKILAARAKGDSALR